VLLRQLLEGGDDDTSTTQKDYHLLTPAAEAELLLLSTNFLLYVALVIITTMVCKIYFPEALERGSGAPIVRSYSYRMVEDDAIENNESYYGSDVSDDDDEENEEVLDSSSEENDREQQQQQQQQQPSHNNLMEFDQTRLSKAQVLKRLAFCSLVLNVTFVAWGVLQVCKESAAVSCMLVICVCVCMCPLVLTFCVAPLSLTYIGTHVDKTLSSFDGGILYLLVCPCLYQSILDPHHVGIVVTVPQTSSIA
jgi:hypothetical protein